MLDCAHSMWRSIGDECVDCDFTGANFADCSLHGRFVRCNFTSADLWRAAAAGSLAFGDCAWESARLSGDLDWWDEMRDAAG